MYYPVGTKISFDGMNTQNLDKRRKNPTQRGSKSKNSAKRLVKPNRGINYLTLTFKILAFMLFTKKGLKITGALIFISWFLSTIEMSYKPFSPVAQAKGEVCPSELPLNGATSYESADMPRDTIDRDGRDYALTELLNNESSNEAGRLNPYSYACGVGQAYPCTKMYQYATKSWINSHKYQKDGKWYIPTEGYNYELNWTKEYIKNRYGNATNALKFWQSQNPHWY